MKRLFFVFDDRQFYSVAHYLQKDNETNIKLWEGLWEILNSANGIDETIIQKQGMCDFAGTRNKLKTSLEKKYGKKCKTYVL